MLCCALALRLPSRLQALPRPLLDVSTWEQLWIEYPEAWHLLLRLARKTVREQPALAAEVMAAWAEPVPGEEADEFLRGICSSWCPMAASVNAHRAKARRAGMARVVKACVAGVWRPACGVDYRSLLRAINT